VRGHGLAGWGAGRKRRCAPGSCTAALVLEPLQYGLPRLHRSLCAGPPTSTCRPCRRSFAAAKGQGPRLATIGSSTHLDELASAGAPGGNDGRSNDGEEGREGEEGDAAAPATAAGWEAGVKWKKLITKALQGAPGAKLKLKGLQSQVAAAVLEKLGKGGEAGAAGVGKKQVRAAVAARVGGSSRFILEGKYVRLRE
jgi:hypothetical protein